MTELGAAVSGWVYTCVYLRVGWVSKLMRVYAYVNYMCSLDKNNTVDNV